ncbi:MAG: rod shape-determining protein [Candidatus Shapirobacteria bacterium]|nr:rod shape-determining protein [Candidatus Shapirobacteria bacterium]
MKLFSKFFANFYWEIGLDMGSSNLKIYVKDKGVVVDEASMVARLKKKKNGVQKMLIFGQKAKEMVNREPKQIEVVAPINRGAIADLVSAEALLAYFMKLINEIPSPYPKILKPRVIVGVPGTISNVQKRAFRAILAQVGIPKVIMVESSILGVLGSGFKLDESGGVLFLDIGGGKTEASLVSMGGVVISRGLEMGGDDFDESIISYVKMKYGLYIGKNTAERVKIEMGGVIRGRDLETNLPQSIRLKSEEIKEATALNVKRIVNLVKIVLDEMPTEMADDVLKRGVVMSGGGSQFPGIDKLIEEEIKINAQVLPSPSFGVVKGEGELLENMEWLDRIKLVSSLS